MFLVLAADPSDEIWTVALQTSNEDEALDFWNDVPGDKSLRIMIDTSNYINFPVDKEAGT